MNASIFKMEIAILFMISLFIIPAAYAGVFNVGVSVTGSCIPQWQCTAFTRTSCGTRECIDVNICGANTGKPAEYVACDRRSSSDGSEQTNESYSFSLSSDLLKEDMSADSFVSRRIKIYSDSDNELSYDISVEGNDEEFIRMVSVSKNELVEDLEFDLLINTSGSAEGVYVGKVVVDNGKYSKSISVIIKILSDGPEFSVSFNEMNTIINASTILIPVIALNDTDEFVNITYSFVSDTGEELFTFSSLNTQGSSINMPMPSGLQKGYYTLKVSVQSGDSVNTKYSTFYADPENTLIPYVEETKGIENFNIRHLLAYLGLIVILVLIILLSIKYYPSVKEKLLLKDKSSSNPSEKSLDSVKKSYEQGFISKQEMDSYNGINTESINADELIKVSVVKENIEKPIIYKRVEESRVPEVNCPPGKEFILHDGSKIYSIKDLFDRLQSMDENVFYHHVTPERNDFANWIRDVFKEEGLASRVSACKTKKEMGDLR